MPAFIGINPGKASYFDPCPLIDHGLMSKWSYNTASAVVLAPLPSVPGDYVLYLSPDVTWVAVPGLGLGGKPINGQITFQGLYSANGKDCQFNLSSKTPQAVKCSIFRSQDALSRSLWKPEAIALGSNFLVSRFMDWCDVNDTKSPSWVTPDDTKNFYAGQLPIEYMMDYATNTKTHAWINIPPTLSVDAAVAVIILARKLLPSQYKLFVEWSNEVWNTGFMIGQKALATGNPKLFYAQNVAALSKAIQATGLLNTYIQLCWQFGNGSSLTTLYNYYISAGGVPDLVYGLCPAPYIYPIGKDSAGNKIDWPSRSDDDLIASMQNNLPSILANYPKWAAACRALNKKFCIYELNVSPISISERNLSDSEILRRARIARDPRCAQMIQQSLTTFEQCGGNFACLYESVGNNCFGILREYESSSDPRLELSKNWNVSATRETAMNVI